MRIAILATMVVVAFSSNPLIHKDLKADERNTTRTVSASTQTATGRDAMEKVRTRIAQRRLVVVRTQEYGN